MIEKIAYIRKRKGKWYVLSEKGKSLGAYDTKAAAVKRLKQIEWFKAHSKKTKKKASKNEETYSSIMRKLVKNDDKELMHKFQMTFKKEFDAAYIANNKCPEEKALEAAKSVLKSAEFEYRGMLYKAATAVDLGDPVQSGRYLADLIRWLLQRISPQRRQKALDTMRRKIYYINEYDIAAKKTPASSSMGQAITLLKNILLEHNPQYIRAVLNNIVKFL